MRDEGWHCFKCFPGDRGFPGDSHDKKSTWILWPACGRPGFNPWVGMIPWKSAWQLTPVFLPGKFHGQRREAWWVTVHGGHKERQPGNQAQRRWSYPRNESCLREAWTHVHNKRYITLFHATAAWQQSMETHVSNRDGKKMNPVYSYNVIKY